MTKKERATKREAIFRKEIAKSMRENQGYSERDELEYKGRASGFVVLPDEFTYTGGHLSHGAKMTWIAIFRHNYSQDPTYRVSWPGRERLAILICRSVRQVTTYLMELKEKGLLLTQRRKDKTSYYLLYDPPIEWMKETKEKIETLKIKQKRKSKL